MIKNIEFLLNDDDPHPIYKWVGLFAIEENIAIRLKEIKEFSHSKWKIDFSNGNVEDSCIKSDNGRKIEMTLFLDFKKIKDCKEPDSIKLVYKMIFDAFSFVWISKNWNIDILHRIHKEIESDQYKIKVLWGKEFQSPDQKFKVQRYCDLMPDYADLYVRFINKKTKEKHDIKFLKGNLNPERFYGLFINSYWPDNENFIISDYHQEIFYVFNVRSDQFTIEYKPKVHTLEELKNCVKLLEYTPYE